MKVNRRSFFSVAAAAPVAAKQVATSVLDYEAKVDRNFAGTPIGYGGSALPSDSSWLQSELKEAIQSRRKLETQQPRNNYARDIAAYIQIDNRRSTSPAVRALLIAEERAKREKARELSYIDQRIADLKEKLGPLAMIFEGDA